MTTFHKIIEFPFRDYTAFTVYHVITDHYATFMLPEPDGRRSPVIITEPELIAEFTLACRSRLNADQNFHTLIGKYLTELTTCPRIEEVRKYAL